MASDLGSEIALREISQALDYDANDESPIEALRPPIQVRQHEIHSTLPTVDGGREAWMFLAGSFFIEALVWGFPFSFGVFQEYYAIHKPFSEEQSGIAVIGSSAMGIMYLGAPFTFAALQWWPKYRRYYAAVGLGIIAIALVLSSFSTRVWHLILTQGVLYAIGGILLYTPTVLFLDEWFIKRKGAAYGVMWAGTGVSGICVPLVMNWGLGKYGHSTMLRTWAITVVILSAPLLYYVKPRIPISVSSRPRRLDMSFVRTSTFWTLQTGNILESLGFFIPNIWLPTYARSIGLSSLAGTMTVIMFNTTSILSQVLLGILTDRMHVTDVILVSTIGAALSVFLFWGLAASLPLLCILSLVYGLFAGGFSSTWTGAIREVQKKKTFIIKFKNNSFYVQKKNR
ncbi:MAG: hypothetical protein Q9195_006234 [Heterodermia aff. obscurata]